MVKVLKGLFVALLVLTTLIVSVFATPIEVTSLNVEQDNNGEYIVTIALDNTNPASGTLGKVNFAFEGQSKEAEIVEVGNTTVGKKYNLRDVVTNPDSLRRGQSYTIAASTDTSTATKSFTFLYGSIQEEDNFDVSINEVKVNGKVMNSNDKLQVTAGSTLNVDISFTANVDMEDANFRAIVGYDHGDITDTTDLPNLKAGVTYFAQIALRLPTDMDSEDDYKLRILGSNFNSDLRAISYDLYVDTDRDRVDIINLMMTPNSGVEAGENLIASVRMENLGQDIQDNVKVTVAVPDLDLEAFTYVTNLAKNNIVTSDDLLFFLDEDVEAGRYDVVVTLSYDDNYKTTTETFDLIVRSPQVIEEENLLVNFNNNVNMVAGEAKSFKVVIANPNTESKPISVAALENTWADVEIDPSLSMVKGGDSSEYTITVTPKSSIVGERSMTLFIKEGSTTIKELSVNTYIEGKEQINWINVALAVLLVVAIIILLSLIITIAKRKNGEGDDYSSTEEYY